MASRFHPVRVKDWTPVHYSEEQWRLLEHLRRRAGEIIAALAGSGIRAYAVGSVARGDVTPQSDIDIHTDEYTPTFIITTQLARHGFKVERFELVQATPEKAIKIVVVIDEKVSISIPASRLTRTEEEFKKFAGYVSLDDLRSNVRVPGVNKRLLLIKPTEYGHVERSVLGFENETAQILGISLETIQERIRMRFRRATKARAGLFLHEILPPDASPEKTLLQLAKKLPSLRQKLAGVLL